MLEKRFSFMLLAIRLFRIFYFDKYLIMTTGLFLIILLGVSFAAPFIRKYLKNAAGWVYAIWPFAGFLYYLSLLPAINSGQVIQESHTWIGVLGLNFSFYVDGFSLLPSCALPARTHVIAIVILNNRSFPDIGSGPISEDFCRPVQKA